MSKTRTSLIAFLLALALPVTGAMLWMLHADAWGVGERSPILSYDAAQYALAARELATHGHLATTFALPIELARHPQPPWPLAVVQPGLVLAEAALFRLTPPVVRLRGVPILRFSRPDQREWLVLVLPFFSFILIGLLLAIATSRLLRRHAAWLPEGRRLAAAFTVGMAFYLDPEAQHFATGGFTELPFTLGLLIAFIGLALGWAQRRPLLFGLVLGLTGTLRANMVGLAPVLALAAMTTAPRGRRLRVLAWALIGYAAPLAPWWIYKWRAFGSPGWDLTRLVVWDSVQGRSWFSLYHLPEMPTLPTGLAAVPLLAAKVWSNFRPLLLLVATGPRALWLAASVIWLMLAWPWRRTAVLVPPDPAAPPPAPPSDLRPVGVAVLAALACFALSLLTAAVSIPWLRYVFPARTVLEVVGLLSVWGVVAIGCELISQPFLRRVLHIAAGLLVLGWGSLQTVRGNAEARVTSYERGIPNVLSLMQITVLMNREIPPREAVMSNLGPTLAWHASRPVLHLALSPDDLDACRRRLDFHHVLLVFRGPDAAWPQWREVIEHPETATARPEWNVRRMREWRTSDGFLLIWLDLKPLPAQFAARPAAPAAQPLPLAWCPPAPDGTAPR